MLKDINKGKMKRRQDTYQGGKRVELHAHTKMSAMDGLNEVSNLVKTAAAWGQPAVEMCIRDSQIPDRIRFFHRKLEAF